MKLELGTFLVKDIIFSDSTRLKEGVLSINRQELKDVIAQAPNFEDVEIDVARPGEETRIIHVLDITEPRFKVSGGIIFPGILGSPHIGGQGRTHRLSGMAVVEASEPVTGEPEHWREGIIDMSSPGALYSPFAETVNLVLTFKPKPSFLAESPTIAGGAGTPSSREYTTSVRVAGLKASAYLAQVTEEMEPDKLDTYELKPVDPSLPRIAIAHRLSNSRFYGESTTSHLATLVHPNEFMDGALVSDQFLPAASREFTYFDLNHPVASELYSRHGKDLNFVGAILYGGVRAQQVDSDRVASYAANLVELLKAQGIILAGMPPSFHGVMVMFLCQKLERKGIKTAIISDETLTKPGDTDAGFTQYVPEAVAVVSAGMWEEEVALPPVKKVIGGSKILQTNKDAAGAINVPVRYLCGATSRIGAGKLVCKQY